MDRTRTSSYSIADESRTSGARSDFFGFTGVNRYGPRITFAPGTRHSEWIRKTGVSVVTTRSDTRHSLKTREV